MGDIKREVAEEKSHSSSSRARRPSKPWQSPAEVAPTGVQSPRQQPTGKSPLLPAVAGALTLALGLGIWITPKATAAWRTLSRASEIAGYAKCAAGPTGPELLHSDEAQYLEVLRRRVLHSPAGSRPFSACADLAAKISEDGDFLRAHRVTAVEFEEHRSVSNAGVRARVSHLLPPIGALRADYEQGSLFLKESLSAMMKPSQWGKQAPFYPPLMAAGSGSGLGRSHEIYRATAQRGGRNWVRFGVGANARVHSAPVGATEFSAASSRALSDVPQGCSSGEGSMVWTLSLGRDDKTRLIRKTDDAAPLVEVVAEKGEDIAALVCGARGAAALVVTAARVKSRRQVDILSCPSEGYCQRTGEPGAQEEVLSYPADIAMVGGAIVVSTATGGLTRVASSRDAGAHWTGWTVAWDSTSAAGGGLEPRSAPFRLLSFGDSMMLYTGGAGSYPLLWSEDAGASFRAEPPKADAVVDRESAELDALALRAVDAH